MPVKPGQAITFDVDLSGLSLARDVADLALEFDGGAKMTLSGFFTADAQGKLPVIMLDDGKLIDGGDFLRGLDPDFDISISSAAGPQQSGGAGEYDDDGGALVNGVDRLGVLGRDQWGTDMEPDEEYSALPASGNPDAEAPTPPVTPEKPEPPVVTPEEPVPPAPEEPEEPEPPVEPDPYHARLVVNASESGMMRVAILDADGNIVTDPAAVGGFRFGNALYFNPPTVDPVTGELVITLTQAGLEALERGESFDDILYITVNGNEYPMHLMGNGKQGHYDVADAESAAGLPGPLLAEWYSHESGEMLDGKSVILGGEKYNQADVVVQLESGTASGMGNANISLADGVEGKVQVTAGTENGSAYAVRVGAFGEDAASSIDAGSRGDVNINAASGNATAMGLVTQSGKDENDAFYKSTADVHGRDISFSTSASEKTAAGIWASGKSEVNIRAEGNVNFLSTSVGGAVNYLTAAAYAADQSVVNISGINVSAESRALKGGDADGVVMSTGFRATTGTEMNISTAEYGKFSVLTYQEHSPYSSPYSGVSWNGGRAAGFTSIGVSASGNVNQWGSGTRSALNVNAGDVEIASSVDASSDRGTATGVYAGYGGDVTINTSDLDNILTIRGDAPSWGVGVFSTNNGSTAINTGKGDDTLRIGASAHNGAAAIGLAAQAGGSTVIDGGEGYDSLVIESVFTGNTTLGTDYMDTTAGAFGMNSAWGYASNTIRNVENVTITADASGSDSGWAYGMFTRDGWGYTVKNIIENTGSPLTVVITAKAGAAGQAYAMYGVAGGHNLIQGGSRDGDLNGDSVTLNGNIGGWNNLNEVKTGSGNDSIIINGSLTGGSNVFGMGNGDDRFTLNGGVTGGNNSIDMGAGDDIITLNGSVAGTLKISGGDGYDILVLQAESFADFTARYDAWLKGSIGDIQVENIHVNINGLSAADQSALESYFSDGIFSGYDIGYSAGAAPFSAGGAGVDFMGSAPFMAGILDSEHDELDFLNPGADAEQTPISINIDDLFNIKEDIPGLNGSEAGNTSVTADTTSPAVISDGTQGELHYAAGDESGMLMMQQEILTNFCG